MLKPDSPIGFLLWGLAFAALGAWAGREYGMREARQEAAARGAGQWRVHPQTGERQFVWRGERGR